MGCGDELPDPDRMTRWRPDATTNSPEWVIRILLSLAAVLCVLYAQTATSAPSREAAPRAVVSYLTVANVPEWTEDLLGDSSACSWRIYDPSTGRDTLFLGLHAAPMPIRWDPEFRQVRFAAAGAIWQAEWRLGAPTERLAPLPPSGGFCDFWRDSSTGVLHAVTSHEPDPMQPAVSRVWTWSEARGIWSVVATDSSQCKYGGCSCIDPVLRPFHTQPQVELEDLMDSMRIEHHPWRDIRVKRSFEPDAPEEDDDGPVLVPLACGPGELEVRVSTGDTEHAMEPLVLVDQRRRLRRPIYEQGASHDLDGGQIAFSEYRCLLLVTAELSGAYGRLIDLRTGHTMRRLPGSSAAAVWVPAPASLPR